MDYELQILENQKAIMDALRLLIANHPWMVEKLEIEARETAELINKLTHEQTTNN